MTTRGKAKYDWYHILYYEHYWKWIQFIKVCLILIRPERIFAQLLSMNSEAKEGSKDESLVKSN